jgi:RNA polymerase sigma-70 factor (ECF subfamily)
MDLPGTGPGASSERVWPPTVEVVLLAIEGDRRAITDLLVTGYPRLMAFYQGIGLSRHEAEDLAAETTEALVTGINRLRAAQAFEAWFWSVARNRLRTLFRRRNAAKPVDAMVSPSSPEELSVEREEHLRIRAAMAQLPNRDRQLLWLREVEGLEYEDLATRLGSSPGAIRVACHRARRRLEDIYLADEG